jgi:hypothetical protein
LTTNLNKKILISSELFSSAVGIFFQELGFELFTQSLPNEHYAFAIDNACPELINIPRLHISKAMDEKLASKVRGFIDQDFFKHAEGKKLLATHFNESADLDLIERYSENLKTVYNVKLQDYLNIGFFIDSIIIDAYKSSFDITPLRNYLNTMMNFSFKKVELNSESMPIDISYSHDEDAFAVEISMIVDSFNGKEEFKNIFNELMENINYLDVTYFPKKSKLTISSLIFKDPKMKKARSYFFTEVTKRIIQTGDLQTNLYSGLMLKEGTEYAVHSEVKINESKIQIARKLARFIKNTRKKDEYFAKIERGEIDNYLALYPREEITSEIDEVVKDLAFKILKFDESNNGMNEYIQKVAGSNLNEEISNIQKVLGSKSLGDFEEILAIKNLNRETALPYSIKAWVEKEEENLRITGVTDISKNEIWAIKSSQMNEKIQEELVRIRGEGKNIVLDDIIKIVSTDLNASPDDVRPFVEWVVEEVVADGIAKNKKLEEVFTMDLFQPKEEVPMPTMVPVANQILTEKLQDQNSRMKKIMEQMKRELIKLQNEKAALEVNGLTVEPVVSLIDKAESVKLKNALTVAMKNISTKERIIDKLRSDVDANFKIKDDKISALEKKIEELKYEKEKNKSVPDKKYLEELEVENKILVMQLEQANKKNLVEASSLTTAKAAPNIEDEAKHEKEIEALKMSVQMAQVLIERLKHDKHEMEMRFLEEKEAIVSENEEKIMGLMLTANTEGLSKKDGPITALTNEKKALEDRLRAQGLELKKVEQKLKFANSQLDSSSLKKDAKASVKSNEVYAKQLDLMNIRMENAIAEVAEKRKEIHKYKLENTTLSMRISELEKKVALYDKKAS